MVVVSKQRVVRQPGYIYYVKDGYVWASPRKGVNGTKHKVNNEYLPETKGKMCHINSEGFVVVK